ncbi:hypothetical protein BJH93_04020 [Kocuria polaris]|nr:hypothetical protein [Kocuria polaris]
MARRHYKTYATLWLKLRLADASGHKYRQTWISVGFRDDQHLRRLVEAAALGLWPGKRVHVDVTTLNQPRGATITLAGQAEPCAWFGVNPEPPAAEDAPALLEAGGAR